MTQNLYHLLIKRFGISGPQQPTIYEEGRVLFLLVMIKKKKEVAW